MKQIIIIIPPNKTFTGTPGREFTQQEEAKILEDNMYCIACNTGFFTKKIERPCAGYCSAHSTSGMARFVSLEEINLASLVPRPGHELHQLGLESPYQ